MKRSIVIDLVQSVEVKSLVEKTKLDRSYDKRTRKQELMHTRCYICPKPGHCARDFRQSRNNLYRKRKDRKLSKMVL